MNGYDPSFEPDIEEHAKLAEHAAAEGIVLLENKENTLPLLDEKRIAVFGKISYYPIAFGTGSGGVRSFKYRVSVNEGLKNAGFDVYMSFAWAVKLNGSPDNRLANDATDVGECAK